MPLRKESARTGPLRLIDVEDFDLSACGGTHVARTGAIGMIAIGGWEKFRGGSRVEFLCGGRALRAIPRRGATRWRRRRSICRCRRRDGGGDRADAGRRARRSSDVMRGFQEKLAAHEAHALLAQASGGDRWWSPKRSRAGTRRA